MSKQKRKLKKNQVALDNKIYDITHPAYGDIYENKIATDEVYWDEDSQQWLTTLPTIYVSPPKWNKRLSREKNEKIYQKWQEKQDPNYVPISEASRRDKAAFRELGSEILNQTGITGAYRFAQDPLKNLQGTANILSYASLPGLAMHGLDYMQGKPFFNVTSEDLEGLGNTFDVAGLATLGAAPLIKQGLKVAPKLLSTSKTIGKVPKVNVADINKFKNQEGIDYVKNVTSDPRYAQKAKELDAKYSDNVVQERPINNNLIDQQQTSEFNPFKGQTKTRRVQRMNPYRPSQMFGELQDKYKFKDAAGPFTRMANYTQTPEYYNKIFTDVDFVDEYLKQINKSIDDLTPEEIRTAEDLLTQDGIFHPGVEDIQVSTKTAIPHELKHKEHFTKKWSPTFPEKYKQVTSQNFDESGDLSKYIKYRLKPIEQEAWLSRDLKKSMVDKGYLETPFDEIDEATLNKFIETDNEIFTPELNQRLNKPNFLKWVNETLPAATGVTTAGAIGSQLIPQEGIAPEQKAYGGKINNMKKKNNLPKLAFGAPQLFDLAANTLINGTTYAVTDMIKAIREPEQEMRPTKRNTGFVMENGGMIKRADGSYSKRGLWDNIRANKGSGKKPTKQMLEQERKIRAAEKAFGGMITPDMYMQQMMYGSYAQGGQVPQNIPVEVEGGEAYELPNGEMGEFEGPSHDNGGIPVALPEQTKVYSKQLKVNGKTMADRKTKREANVAKLEKILSKNPSDKFIREALKRQQETATLEEQSDMAMQEQANQQQQMQQQAQQGMMQEQGMQQEQVMAGMMQDPAMMQQMGMMMYGGKLNKLANGGEPIKPLPMRQIYDLRYPNKTIDVPYNEKLTGVYNNNPVTQEMFPLNNDIPNPLPMYNPFTPDEWKTMTNTEFYEGDGYPLTGYGINSSFTNPDELNKFYDAKLKDVNTLSRKSSLVPTVKNNYLEEMADLAQRASGGRGTSFTVYPNDYDGRDKQWPNVVTFGGKSMQSNTNKYTPSVVKENNPDPNAPKTETTKPNVTDTNPPFFTEEQFNQLTNPQINPLDTREKKGGVNVTNTNPYDAMNKILGNTFQNIAQSKDPYINTKGGMIPNPLYNEVIGNKMLKEEDPKKPNKFMNFLNNAADKTGDFFTGLFDGNGKPKKEKAKKGETKVDGDLPLTAGDRMGMAGTLFGGLAPMTTTMLNRMMTPKNQNFFREYGAEGLRAMQEAQSLSGINRDKQLADIKLGEEASRQRGRNSARGVNTLRAMDISSDIAANQAQNQAYNSYAQQMMQMLGQKGQMENQQDQMVMQGEYNRDLADRQDVDNFYTNLAENFASQSELMQKQGRDMNQAQYNKMILQMSPMFSKYGIGMDIRNGQYVLTYNGEDIDQTKARLIVEKGIEAEKKAAVEATKKEEKKEGTTTKAENNPATFNPLGLGHTPYFNPIFTDINIPTVTDKSLTKAATKRR